MEENNYKIELLTGEVIYKNIKLARSFEDRLMGLMFKKKFEDGVDGIIIEPCKSIHTFFMRMNIDVVFLNKQNEIVKIIYDMKPWDMSKFYFKASKVLEVEAGSFPKNLCAGEKLKLYV